jgi:hypothetical protein
VKSAHGVLLIGDEATESPMERVRRHHRSGDIARPHRATTRARFKSRLKRIADMGVRSVGGLPSTIYAANVETFRSRGRPENVMTICGHLPDATAKFPRLGSLQDWQLLPDVGRG